MQGCCDCGNEPSGSLKCEEFFTSLGPVNLSSTVLHVVGSLVD